MSGHRVSVERRAVGQFPESHASDSFVCQKQTRLLRSEAARLHGGHGHKREYPHPNRGHQVRERHGTDQTVLPTEVCLFVCSPHFHQ